MTERFELSELTIGSQIPFEDQVELPDGTVGHFHLENPVVGDDGKVIGFVVSFHSGDHEHDEDDFEDGHEHSHSH